MGTLASELGAFAGHLAGSLRVYVDANIPAGVVAFMRARLRWDVLFVIEHEGLRRAPDWLHYRRARELRRTLITLDRDYLDDRKFPPMESGGVLVLTAPEDKRLIVLLTRLDQELFRLSGVQDVELQDVSPLPLEGRKLHVHVDWQP